MAPKRPLLPREDRARLAQMAGRAARHKEENGTSRAYAQGVADVLSWLCNAPMTPLLQEVTR